MLTHDNFYSNVKACAEVLPFRQRRRAELPPAVAHLRADGATTSCCACGVSIAYAESIDTVPANMQEVRPTVVLSVPRLYEKMYARVLENALAGGAREEADLLLGARRRRQMGGRDARRADAAGPARPRTIESPRSSCSRSSRRAPAAACATSCRAARRSRRRSTSSSTPPASTILEGYGLTETSPVIAVNTPRHFRIGTVGRPIPGVEVTIAPDGEILTRGPHVMKGYYNKPEATREAIDADGWFHTGDIGELRDGFLAITDRKKDIIVTAGGKNIAPQPIENMIKTNKYVSQAVMIGDKRKFPIVLVVPNFEQLERWAKIKNLLWTDRRQLLNLPLVQAKMEKEVLRKLSGLASLRDAEEGRAARARLLDRERGDDPHAQGEAPGHREAVRGPHRPSVRRGGRERGVN